MTVYREYIVINIATEQAVYGPTDNTNALRECARLDGAFSTQSYRVIEWGML
jgi:hypothetical protein